MRDWPETISAGPFDCDARMSARIARSSSLCLASLDHIGSMRGAAKATKPSGNATCACILVTMRPGVALPVVPAVPAGAMGANPIRVTGVSDGEGG